MEDTFRATNGATLEKIVAAGRRITYSNGLSYPLPAYALEALREFFRSEEDERLGLWRSSVDPSWTAAIDSGPEIINFRHEDGLRAFEIDTDGSGIHRWDPALQAVAREFLDAHPEPKPWHDAKPGEVWALTWDDTEGVFLHASGTWYGQGDVRVALEHPIRDNNVTAGRRIWPEEAS